MLRGGLLAGQAARRARVAVRMSGFAVVPGARALGRGGMPRNVAALREAGPDACAAHACRQFATRAGMGNAPCTVALRGPFRPPQSRQRRWGSHEASARTAEEPKGPQSRARHEPQTGSSSGGSGKSGASTARGEAGAAASGKPVAAASASKSTKEALRQTAAARERGAGTASKAVVSQASSGDASSAVWAKYAAMVLRAPITLTTATLRALVAFVREPIGSVRRLGSSIKEVAEHYWLGSKLLVSDVRTATRLLRRVLGGHRLSRRERKQLMRTAVDLARLVPFAFFVLVPFMELLLPVALKLFPSMLPSTFQSAYARQENLLRNMRLRMELTSFMHDTMMSMARKVPDEEASQDILRHLDSARKGDTIDNDVLLELARLFKDEVTLDNASRNQLVTMCQYMGLGPYGGDGFLRFQLRNKVRQLKNDDQLILWEGVSSLDLDELRQACADRGMRSTGLTKTGYRQQLTQWLELSVSKEVPVTLLLLSRAFTMPRKDEDLETALTASISAMEDEVVNEAVLEASGADSTELRRRKLDSLRYQNELIEGEEKEKATEPAAETASGGEHGAAEELLRDPYAEGAAGEAAKEELEALPVEEVAVGEASGEGKESWVERRAKEIHRMMEAVRAKRKLEEIEQQPGQEHGLTADEMDALTRLASDSAVQQERERLEQLLELQQLVEAEERQAVVARQGEDAAQDRSTGLVKRKVSKMTAALEREMERVDSTIGKNLRLMDKDMDGVLSADELREAVKVVLATHNTDTEAQAIVDKLDRDKDGKVTVRELLKFAVRQEEAKW